MSNVAPPGSHIHRVSAFFKHLFSQVLDHDSNHEDMIALFERFQAALQVRQLAVKGKWLQQKISDLLYHLNKSWEEQEIIEYYDQLLTYREKPVEEERRRLACTSS